MSFYLNCCLYIVSTVSVEISTSGTPIVGEDYTLMCSVTGDIESLNATTTIEWRDSDGSLVTSNAILTFSPLLFSNRGYYTCRVRVSSPYLENDLVPSAVEDITFEGIRIFHKCIAGSSFA